MALDRRGAMLLAGLLLGACGGGGGDVGDVTDVPPPPPAETPAGAPPIGQTQSGKATFYDATGAGACSYDPSSDLMVAAMNAVQYANSEVCGMCVEVTGPKGTVVVRIVDLCPECGRGHLDLSRQAFAAIADLSAGEVPISWTPRACVVSGPIALRFKEGSSAFWMAVQVRNSRLPIRRIELRQDSDFVALERQSYNYSTREHAGPGPFDFRITAVDGQQLIERNVPLREAQVVQGTQQFQ